MKKRILSLALALVMLFSLVLMSCDDEEESSSSEPAPVVTPEPEPEPEPPVEDLIDNITLTDKKVGDSTYLTAEIGECDSVTSLNNHFLLGTTNEISPEDSMTVLSKTYTYVSVYTGAKISYKVDLAKTNEDADYNTTITNVTASTHSYNSEFLVVTVTYGNFAEGESGTRDVILYNRLGAKVAERKFTADDKYDLMLEEDNAMNDMFYALPFICFDGIVYFIEDNCALTKAYDAHKSVINPYDLIYNEDLGIFLYYESEGGVYNLDILDKTLAVIKSIKFEVNRNADDVNTIMLSNYNIIVTEIVYLTDDAEEWDVYSDGEKVNITTYLINAETSEKTELDIDFVPTSIISSTEYELTSKDLNLISYYEIDGKELVEKVNYAVIDNNGKVVKYLNPIIGNSLTVTQNGMKIVSTDFGNYYVDGDGKIIRPVFDGEIIYNNLWAIVNDTMVYDASCNLIYEVPADYIIENINNNSILLSKAIETTETVVADDPATTEVDETQTETRHSVDYYLFKGKDSVTLLFNDPIDYTPETGTVSELYSCSKEYYIVKTKNVENNEIVFKIYDDLGVEKATIDKDCEIMRSWSTDYALYLYVKKTVTTEVEEGQDPVTTVTHHIYSIVLPQ